MYDDQTVLTVNHWLKWGCAAGWGTAAILGISLAVTALRELPPYVFPINGRGQPVGIMYPIQSLQAIPDAQLRGLLSEFIHDTFTVDASHDEEAYLLHQTAARVTGQAFTAISDWYHRDKDAHLPEEVYYKETADVIIRGSLKLPPKDTYEVDYTVINHSHNDTTTTNYRAVMHAFVGNSDNPESLGVFIDTLSFTPEQSQ